MALQTLAMTYLVGARVGTIPYAMGADDVGFRCSYGDVTCMI